jgi:membrane protein CcdC involved in cytochrome C biogenesis
MNVGFDISHFILLLIAFTVIMLVVQRAEPRRRLVVAIVMLGVGILIQRYANYRAAHTEALVAFLAGILLNALFWLFIGRYNPPGSSDDIQVLGMDD